MLFFRSLSWFFRNQTLLGAVVFCVAFSASRRFFWAIKNCFWATFHIFIIRGDPCELGGQKVTRHGKKVQKNFNKKFKSGCKMEQENRWYKFCHHKWCYRDTLLSISYQLTYSLINLVLNCLMNWPYTSCGRYIYFLINHFWLCAVVVSHSQPLSKWLRHNALKTLKRIPK